MSCLVCCSSYPEQLYLWSTDLHAGPSACNAGLFAELGAVSPVRCLVGIAAAVSAIHFYSFRVQCVPPLAVCCADACGVPLCSDWLAARPTTSSRLAFRDRSEPRCCALPAAVCRAVLFPLSTIRFCTPKSTTATACTTASARTACCAGRGRPLAWAATTRASTSPDGALRASRWMLLTVCAVLPWILCIRVVSYHAPIAHRLSLCCMPCRSARGRVARSLTNFAAFVCSQPARLSGALLPLLPHRYLLTLFLWLRLCVLGLLSALDAVGAPSVIRDPLCAGRALP